MVICLFVCACLMFMISVKFKPANFFSVVMYCIIISGLLLHNVVSSRPDMMFPTLKTIRTKMTLSKMLFSTYCMETVEGTAEGSSVPPPLSSCSSILPSPAISHFFKYRSLNCFSLRGRRGKK